MYFEADFRSSVCTEVFPRPSTPSTTFDLSTEFKRCRTRDQCVTCCGQTRTTDVVGVSVHVELVTRSGRTSPRLSVGLVCLENDAS